MRDEVERQDVQLKKDVSAMRALQSKVNGIVGLCGADIRPEVTKLAEELRYSDPVSSEALAEIEAELIAYADELQAAVVDGDHASARELCKKIRVVLGERNRLCKLNKQACSAWERLSLALSGKSYIQYDEAFSLNLQKNPPMPHFTA